MFYVLTYRVHVVDISFTVLYSKQHASAEATCRRFVPVPDLHRRLHDGTGERAVWRLRVLATSAVCQHDDDAVHQLQPAASAVFL